MSAIFGIVRFDGDPVSARELERMGHILVHRGPDGRYTTIEDGAGIGHCLLRVNREDWYEAQPIQDGGLTLVADLRLDNREALAGAIGIAADVLRDMPDSEVLLAAYRLWGEDCIDHLLGDFVFALWDARSRTLLMARDPMGQRGVYFHHGDGFFAFASEVKALWAVEGVPRRLSELGIAQRVLAPLDPNPGGTIYDAIGTLGGGMVLRLNADGAVSKRTYWEPHAAPEHLGRDEAYYVDAYRAVVTEAVACRVRRLARAPALCFSGGFDSGSIAAIAGPIVAAQGRRIVAVASVLDEGERRLVSDARAAVEAFRPYPFLDLHYYVRGEEGVFTDLETSFAMSDENAGTPYVRRGLLRIAASAGARLVLDGHGGDYTVNVNAKAMLGRILRRGKLGRFVREFRLRVRVTGRTWQQVVRHDVLPALLPLRASLVGHLLRNRLTPVWRNRPVNPAFAKTMFADGAIDPARLRDARVIHHRWRAFCLHHLRKVAAMQPTHPTLAAAHGMDFSRPFHDRRVVELGLAIPESLEFRGGLERHLARHVFADILPARLLARGPGNDAEEPDMFRMAREGAPAALAEARRLDRDGRLSRYLDLDRIEKMVAEADEARKPGHAAIYTAARTIALARFIAWFDASNR
ncbi:MAG: asparagine synthase-related protein [Sphingomonas sp.]|jgi:asparagine synthase (glutamine-hydrolysing)|uniref:asparagine synthase-related protein n=1 Tax=Sphingomonas sp. TaxID=28214 RepID=UPI0035665E42